MDDVFDLIAGILVVFAQGGFVGGQEGEGDAFFGVGGDGEVFGFDDTLGGEEQVALLFFQVALRRGVEEGG